MSKKKITKVVQICDRCGTEIGSTYSKLSFVCPVCKRECCTDCNSGRLFDKYPDVCKDCAEIPLVKKRRERFSKNYWKRIKREETELGKIKLGGGAR